ncbi:MAG: SDR family oxidoreductase [Candidatus Gastranaerophilales bacterium]|nr:SDR family oxidoreductase [Candidatus Gastranaerophilales bacterium]
MKKILITGGAGFIGSNLCNKLVSDNFVYCLDNLYTSSIENISNLLNHPNFEFIQHDITEKIDLEVDEIYNLACPASPIHYQNESLNTLKSCVIGIYNILELAKKSNAKILQASTSEIYGDPLIHPQNESYWGNVNPLGDRSCYDEGKRCAETFMYEYYKNFNLKIRIARIFNTYGRNMQQNDGRVISNFIVQALKNEDITIYGTGNQTRSFCYIDDLTDGLIKLMNNPDDFIGPINLGNDSEYSILDIAKIILDKINTKSKIVFKELPNDDPKMRKPDITKAKLILNWEPKIDLNNGLDKTIEYFNSLLTMKV